MADAHFQIAMLQSNQDELEDRHEAVKRNKRELEAKLAERDAEIAELRSELADLKQNSATAGKEFPEPAKALDRLRVKRGKKTKADLSDVIVLWEILEEENY